MPFFGSKSTNFDDPEEHREGKDAEWLSNGSYRLVINRHVLIEELERHKKYEGAPGFIVEATVKEVLDAQVYVKEDGANVAYPSVHRAGDKVKILWPLPAGKAGAIFRDKMRAHMAPLIGCAPGDVTNEILSGFLEPTEEQQKRAAECEPPIRVGPEAFAGRELCVAVKPGLSSKGTQFTNFYWRLPPGE